MPFVRVLIQEMRGGLKDLCRPPTEIQSGVEGEIEEEQPVLSVGGGAPPQLGGRGTP